MAARIKTLCFESVVAIAVRWGGKKMEENGIIDAFHQLCRENSRENVRLFFHEVKHSVLWVPVSAGKERAPKVEIPVLISSAGKKYIPAFVSRETVTRPYKKTYAVKMEYNRLKQLITGELKDVSGIVISPFRDNIFIDKALMQVIDEKMCSAS